jgi:hypothetical protein
VPKKYSGLAFPVSSGLRKPLGGFARKEIMDKVFILLTDDEITGAPAWALRDEVKRLTAEILRLRKLQAAQQSVQLTAAGVESDGENQDSGGN